MIDCLAFVGNLQAALTHAEVHGVHVDLTWKWLVLRGFRHVCLLVLENWHLNFDLCTSSLADRFYKA